MTYIMSCVWLDYMVKYFQCKNCVGSSPKTKKCVASFLVPGDIKWLKKDIAYENSDCIGAFGVKGTVFQSLKVSKNRVETMSKPPCWLSEFC